MNKIFAALMALLVGAAAVSALSSQETQGIPDSISKALDYLACLTNRQYAKAVTFYNEPMQKIQPADKLKESWEKILSSNGKFRKVESYRTEKYGPSETAIITCEFERNLLDLRIMFNSDFKADALFFQPSYELPSYVRTNGYVERECAMKTGRYSLTGILTLPRGDGPFPVVILVPDSGPRDKDSALLGNRPFRDIALGLSSRGIAVFRYDKASKVFPDLFSGASVYTAREDFLDDVMAAITALQGRKDIDTNGVYVLGHGAGGMLLPRLAFLCPGLAGLIMAAAPAQPLEDMLRQESDFLFSIEKKQTDELKKKHESALDEVKKVKEFKTGQKTGQASFLLGLPLEYWDDLKAYDQVKTAQGLTNRFFIMQGQRDFRVTTNDFKIWQKALTNQSQVKQKLYPDLNHLFIEGWGAPGPADFEKTGHVSAEVIIDIANWIKKKK